MADLYRVSPGGLESIWKQLSATWRERSRGREGPTAGIRSLIMLREVQLWAALPDQNWLARDHRNQPLGILLSWTNGKQLAVHIVAGRKITTWFRRAVGRLDDYRRAHSLEGMDIYARIHWRPYLEEAVQYFRDVTIEEDDGLEAERLKRSA